MVESKSWYESKAMWGAILTIVALLASFFGYKIDVGLQAELVEQILKGIAVVTAVFAAYGRAVAEKVITK